MKNYLKVMFLILFVTFLGCGKEKEIIIAQQDGYKKALPFEVNNTTTIEIESLIYGRAFNVNNYGEIVYNYIEPIKFIDETTCEVTLLKNIKFHNGSIATIEDLEFSFDYMLKHENDQFLFKSIDSFYINDNGNLIIKLKYHDTNILKNIAIKLYLLNKEYMSNVELENYIPMGAGPYKYKEYLESEKLLILEANKEYVKGEPEVKILKVKEVEEKEKRFLGIKLGEFDIIVETQISKEKKKEYVLNNSKLEIAPNNYLGTTVFLSLNVKAKEFKETELKKAISLAIDRKKIANDILGGAVEEAYSIIPKGVEGFTDKKRFFNYNKEEAKKIIAKLMEKREKKIILSIKIPDVENYKKVANYIAEELEEIGLSIDVIALPWNEFLPQTEEGRYKMALYGWQNMTGTAYYSVCPILSPEGNRSFYKNEEMGNLITQLENFTTQENLEKQVSRVDEIIATDLPVIPLYYNGSIAIKKKNIKNLTVFSDGLYDYSNLKIDK